MGLGVSETMCSVGEKFGVVELSAFSAWSTGSLAGQANREMA
jgi:hypothetical protein